MNKSILSCIIAVSLGLCAVSCSSGGDADKTGTGTADSTQSITALNVAPGIVYDVEILNPNPEDGWIEECLEPLDHEAMVNFVFDGLYSGDFKAFDIFEGSRISAKKIRKMEESGEFSRERIGKFQFKEEWVLDPSTMSFAKKVTEIRMGLQNFYPNGTVRSYNPLFRVVL